MDVECLIDSYAEKIISVFPQTDEEPDDATDQVKRQLEKFVNAVQKIKD